MPRLALGGLEITLVREAIYHWDGGAVFGVVPKTLWSRKVPADDLNRVAMGLNCYVVSGDDYTVLIETGAGDKLEPRARERMKLPPARPLPEIVDECGIDPDSIDIVINSHLHWDHCGGNTTVSGAQARPAFPKAVYYACRGEWEHAHTRHPRDSVSYHDLNYDPLVASGQMRLIDGAFEVVPGIRMEPAPGHNRDMMVVTAESEGRKFCFLSDLVPTVAHLKPTWVAAFDLYPLECIDTKTRWLRDAAQGGWICGFGHDAHVAFAGIQARDDSFEVELEYC